MIVTKQKDWEELKKHIEKYNNFLILGCGSCATLCQTGGPDQVENLKNKIQEMNKTVVKTVVIETNCDLRLIKKELVPEAECIISMGCGSGVQATSANTEKPVIGTNNTLFLGRIIRYGKFDERCSLCGDCKLNDYGGICPTTACSKSLLNGPCGGSKNGKCEVDSEKDCGWELIYQRLKSNNNLEESDKYHKPKKFKTYQKPQKHEIKR